jgi:uncharacterized protein
MPQYLAPGVYVEEVPSSAAPIAGVSTSTAGFIGIVRDDWDLSPVHDEFIGKGDGSATEFRIPHHPVSETAALAVSVDGVEADATLTNDEDEGTSSVVLAAAPGFGARVTLSYTPRFKAAEANRPRLCTTWTDFTRLFGDFTPDADAGVEHRWLAHAVYGFFENGGSRCFVVRVPPAAAGINLDDALAGLEAIDEVALVAAPGISGQGNGAADIRGAITSHCEVQTQDRFAIFDSPRDLVDDELTQLAKGGAAMPTNSNYAAFYFPWIEVYDPGLRRRVFAPPSGHMAGVYARVDAQRGVHKAPANEVVHGARALRYPLSKAQQEGLNPHGVNVIRDMNGNICVWGARTIGGDGNGEWKYIPVRRLFLFLRESIDEGTQWTVFEPNTPDLWAKIIRNISAFLTNVWRDGALFGDSPADAFYVKCDADTNPPEVRDQGQVVTEIGVAVVKPAEFVIFRISQWAGPGS